MSNGRNPILKKLLKFTTTKTDSNVVFLTDQPGFEEVRVFSFDPSSVMETNPSASLRLPVRHKNRTKRKSHTDKPHKNCQFCTEKLSFVHLEVVVCEPGLA